MFSRLLFLLTSITCLEASPIPDQIHFESPMIDTLRKELGYSNSHLGFCGEYLRDNYYLPLNRSSLPGYLHGWGRHAKDIVAMLKGEIPDLDPTFPELPNLISRCTVRDIPVRIESGETTYRFNTRVIESKNGPPIRLVLFSFYGNKQFNNGLERDWNPTSTDEIGMAALEVIKAFQKHTPIDSLMCSSLGSLCLYTLKHVQEDCLPNTIIWNRALTSTWKAGKSFYSTPTNYALYLATSYLNLYADPENALVQYCGRSNPKKVVVIEAKEDNYFSGDSALSPHFFERLRSANVELYHGSFLVPMIAVRAHHACRLDWLHNNPESGSSTEFFLPMKNQESLTDGLVRHLMKDKKGHTCFIVGGNLDTLDTAVYLHALPILSSHYRLTKEELDN